MLPGTTSNKKMREGIFFQIVVVWTFVALNVDYVVLFAGIDGTVVRIWFRFMIIK